MKPPAGLIGTWEIETVTYVWLAAPEQRNAP
jgi:hypothetical protein